MKYTLTGAANVGYVHSFETSDISWNTSRAYWCLNNTGVDAHHNVFVPASSMGSDSSNNTPVGAYIRPVIEIQKSSAIVKN